MAVGEWLQMRDADMYYSTSQKVMGSVPEEVVGFCN
jgi:hypothetical protein